MFFDGAEPLSYVTEQGLFMEEDREVLRKTVIKVLQENETSVAEYHAGKEKIIGFLVGQTMKALGGKADPKSVTAVLRECLQIDAQTKA